jgi:hypothetical protein
MSPTVSGVQFDECRHLRLHRFDERGEPFFEIGHGAALTGAATLGGAACATLDRQSQTSIGVLTCTSGAGIEGQGAADNPNKMTCGFKATGGGAEQRYSGMFKMGLNAGAPTGKLVWVWSVVGPETSKLPIGWLAQIYVADARTARGGVMVLTGKSNNAISLQAETAGGAAGALMELELKPLATPA